MGSEQARKNVMKDNAAVDATDRQHSYSILVSNEYSIADESLSLSFYHLTCLIGYSLSFIIFGSQVSILGPTIKPLAEKLGVEATALAPLFTALGISCIVSGPPSGWVVDRFPTHHVLIASLLVEAIGFSLVPLMPSVWSLTLLYFITCFSYNFTNSAVFTSLGWMFPKKAGGSLNLVLSMFGVGSFFIPLAAEACKHLLGSALDVFWLVGALSLLSTIPFLFVESPKKPHLKEKDPCSSDNNNPSNHPKSRGASESIKDDADLTFQELVAEEEIKDKIWFLETLTTASVVFLVFCTTAAETAIGNWLYTYSSNEMGLEDTTAALVNSAFWGAFTAGRVLGVIISPFTTPSTLLLSSVPFSLIGASIPIIFSGEMSQGLILAAAILSGLGNSTGYANALALLEQYVPVTGFINGVFGAVAGAACMVGPTLVALLIQHTTLGYTSMAWVGFIFYALHAPLILTAVGAGSRLLSLTSDVDLDQEHDTDRSLFLIGGDLEASSATPLLSQDKRRSYEEGSPSLPITVHRSPSNADRHAHNHLSRKSVDPATTYAEDVRQPRVSLPGHYGSLSRSSSHRHQGTGGGAGGGGVGGGITGTSPPGPSPSRPPVKVGSLGSSQGGGASGGGSIRGGKGGGGGSSHETTPPQGTTPVTGSLVAPSVFSGSLGYLAAGTHDGDGLLGGAVADANRSDEE